MKILVLGVGNPILRDDGVGIHVVRELKKQLTGVDFREVSVSGLELVELFKGYEKVIIVDAIKTKEGKPGRIYKLTPEQIPTLHGVTPHDADFRTAIEFGEKFIGGMPKKIDIYGIEVEEVTEFGEDLTPDVRKAIPDIIKKIRKDIKMDLGGLSEEIQLEMDGKTLNYCFSCGMCTGGCPSARITDSKYNPRRILHRAVIEGVLDENIWLCTNCYTCQERCPTNTKVADLISLMRRIDVKKNGIPEFIKPLIENLEACGFTAKIGDLENKRRERMNLPKVEHTSGEIKKIIEKTGGGL